MARKFILFLPLTVFFVLVVILLENLSSDLSNSEHVTNYEELHRPLPEFSLPLAYAQGKKITHQDIIGEPTLINFFASWCAPCQLEHPLLMSLSQQGYPVYGILWKDSEKNITPLLQKNGNPYRNILIDGSGSAAIAFGMSGIPESFIIDGKGTILYRHIGMLTSDDIKDRIIPTLESLHNEE